MTRVMNFYKHFNEQSFAQAADEFGALSNTDKERVLKELYYAARNARQPVAVSVIRRTLQPGATFDQFFDSWMPDQEYTDPVIIGDKTHYQYFSCPSRVLNAVNVQNEQEIFSIGLIWCEQDEFLQGLEEMKNSKSNDKRQESITKVVEPDYAADICWVKTDTNLGT